MTDWQIYPLIDKEITWLLNLIVPATNQLILSSKPCLILKSAIWKWWIRILRILSAASTERSSKMVKLWRRYKPFINAGVQELITYRVNFILYRIGDVMGAFVAFLSLEGCLWFLAGVFDSGFSMADITLYIIMSFVTNLLTRSDSSFMIGEEVKDGSIIIAFVCDQCICSLLISLPSLVPSGWFLSALAFHFLSVIVLMKILSGQGIVEVLGLTVLYLFSLTLAYLINFFFNICFGFSAFVFKNLWGSNLLKTSIVAFMSGSLIPLAFFPKVISDILSFLPFASLIYTPVMIIVGKYDASQILQALFASVFSGL